MSGKWDDPEYVREYHRQYRERNREAAYRRHRKYYEANREKAIARAAAHDRKKSEETREARAAIREAKKAATRQRRVEGVRQWRLKNPDKQKNNARNYCHRRRAKCKEPGMLYGAWAAIKADYGHRCAYCGVQGRLEQDHLDPLALGGRHNSTNVVPACGRCNRSKGARTLLQWLAA